MWKYTGGMAVMAFLSTLLTQTDKIVISKMMPLQVFGYYTLAGSLAMAPMILASPIGIAVFPRMTGLVSRGDSATLTKIYHRSCGLVSVLVFPGALTLAMYAGNFIFAWTGSALVAQKAGTVASLLLAGQIMQAITVVPYYLALAYGNVKLNLQIGFISLLFIIPLLIILISKYGAVGGGVAWMVMNFCTLPAYMYFLHRRFLPGELATWCLRVVGRPLFAALPVILLSRLLLPLPSSRIMSFGLIGLVWSLSSAVAAFTISDLRNIIIRKITRSDRSLI
jgi:O-antigen/teichoic acid export membrane protein